MKRFWCCAGVMAVILLAATAASAQCSEQGIAPSNTLAAVKAIRMINTAEAASHFMNHRYLGLQALAQDKVASKVFSRDPKLHFDFTPEAEIVPGFRAVLLVSGDGSQYLLKVFSSVSKCPGAFESDQTGIIYQAQALH